MNEQNLIPLNKRTKSEQRKIAQKGGIKSGEARREKKMLKQLVTEILESEADMLDTFGMPNASGDTHITNAAVLVQALYDKAAQGDVKAFETLMKYAGEDPDQKRKDYELQLKESELKYKLLILQQQIRKITYENDETEQNPFAFTKWSTLKSMLNLAMESDEDTEED